MKYALIILILLSTPSSFAGKSKALQKTFKAQFIGAQDNYSIAEEFYRQCRRDSKKHALCAMAVLSIAQTLVFLEDLEETAKDLQKSASIDIMEDDDLILLSKNAVLSRANEIKNDVTKLNQKLHKLGYEFENDIQEGALIIIPQQKLAQNKNALGPKTRTHFTTQELQSFASMASAGITPIQIARIRYILDRNPNNLLKVLKAERQRPMESASDRNPSSTSQANLFERINEHIKKEDTKFIGPRMKPAAI